MAPAAAEKGRRLWLGLAVALLLIQLCVQVRLASLDSPTTDEGVHLSAGYTYVTRGDFRFNPEHPPLVKSLSAIPLLFLRPILPSDYDTLWQRSENFFYDSWKENRRFGDALLFESGNNADRLIFWARLPAIALTSLLGVTILLIARRHWGSFAALVATALYATNPTVNGHGHLVTTDIALALGFLLSLYSAWQFFKRPEWMQVIWLGGSLGLALVSKHTAIILVPILILLLGYALIWKKLPVNTKLLGRLLTVLAVTWLVIWAAYGFSDRSAPPSASITSESVKSYEEISGAPSQFQPNAKIDSIYKSAQPLLKVLPGNYVKGVFLVLTHTSNGHSSFLLGENSNQGWWYYFPLLFLLKTPLASLLLFGGGIFWLVRTKKRELVLTLAAGAGLFLLFAMSSKANLGLRHILPIFGPLSLIAGWAVTQNIKYQQVAKAVLIWLVLVYAVSFPIYLGYFNELALGSKNGYKIAGDSNLDWGQDLHRIADYVRQNDIERPYVDYGWLGQSGVSYYVDDFEPLDITTADLNQIEDRVIIVGASAIQKAGATFLNATNCKQITSGTFACQIKTANE